MADLTDPFGRRIEYLRVSVTDRCDLRCTYCMPKGFDGFEEPEDWLTFEELERVVAAFTRVGVRRVRLTGGEPLVRKDLPELVARLGALPGIEDLSLSTNAVRLARMAEPLKRSPPSRGSSPWRRKGVSSFRPSARVSPRRQEAPRATRTRLRSVVKRVRLLDWRVDWPEAEAIPPARKALPCPSRVTRRAGFRAEASRLRP